MPKQIRFTLSREELEVLEEAMRHDKRPEVRQRAMVLRLLHLGHRPKEVADMVAVTEATVYNWFRRWRKGGLTALANRPKGHAPAKTNDLFYQLLAQSVQMSPRQAGYELDRWDAVHLQEYLQRESSVRISASRFRAILREQGYSFGEGSAQDGTERQSPAPSAPPSTQPSSTPPSQFSVPARHLAQRTVPMKLNRLLATVLLVGVVALGAWLLTSVTSLTPETDAAREAMADRLALTGQERNIMIGESDVMEESEALMGLSDYFYDRYLYPTYQYDNQWLLDAQAQEALVEEALPAGQYVQERNGQPTNMRGDAFTFLGPNPLQSNGCFNCFEYGLVQGRMNVVVFNPNNTAIAYAANAGGGVYKTTNCCTADTTWTNMTDAPHLQGIQIGELTLDPSNPDIVYAGTGDLRYGSTSFGSSGLLKSTDAGATWQLLGADVFGPFYSNPGTYPQYNAIGKVRVNPNNSQQIAVGTKKGVHFSYDGGATWTAACIVNPAGNQRQDITGMLTRDQGTTSDLIVAVGTRGTETMVQQDLNQNGANGIYRIAWPASGCPGSWTLISTPANGWPAGTGSGVNNEQPGGNILGRIDLAIAASNNDVIYAQVQAVVTSTHNLLGVWKTTNYGTSWTQVADTTDVRNCAGTAVGPQGQNWYDQGLAIDPNNPETVWMQGIDTHRSTDGGVTFGNVSCGYEPAGGDMHVDQHGITYKPGSSTDMLFGNDGGLYFTTNANAANKDEIDLTQINDAFDEGALEFYSGDITADFANSPNPGVTGGMQDNGSAIFRWAGAPGPATWQVRNGGDGMYSVIEPTTAGRIYQEIQNGSINLYTGFTDPTGTNVTGPWSGDRRGFIFPYTINKWGDCVDTDGDTFGCEKLIAGSYRVWETVQGGVPAASWLVNSPDLTKNTLADRSVINQLNYAFDDDTMAIVGTQDGNVQIGFGLGQGVANSATWVNVTGSNTVLPNRPVLDVVFGTGATLKAYAAIGGFSQNTPAQPGHVYEVTCDANCANFTWANKSGNLPDIPVDSIMINPNFPQQVFAGTDWGLYFTNDISVANPVWYRFADPNLPHTMIWDMTVDRGFTTLALFTRGRGVYTWPLPDAPIPTAVEVAALDATTGNVNVLPFVVAGLAALLPLAGFVAYRRRR